MSSDDTAPTAPRGSDHGLPAGLAPAARDAGAGGTVTCDVRREKRMFEAGMGGCDSGGIGKLRMLFRRGWLFSHLAIHSLEESWKAWTLEREFSKYPTGGFSSFHVNNSKSRL